MTKENKDYKQRLQLFADQLRASIDNSKIAIRFSKELIKNHQEGTKVYQRLQKLEEAELKRTLKRIKEVK